MKKADIAIARIIKVFEALLIVLGVIMSVLTFGNAICRKFGIARFYWADEVNRYSFIYMTYIGLIVATYRGSLAAVDVLLDKLSVKTRIFVTVLGELSAIVFLSLLLYGGIHILQFAGMDKSPILRIPLNLVYIILPIGAGCTIVLMLYKMLKELIGLLSNSKGGA